MDDSQMPRRPRGRRWTIVAVVVGAVVAAAGTVARDPSPDSPGTLQIDIVDAEPGAGPRPGRAAVTPSDLASAEAFARAADGSLPVFDGVWRDLPSAPVSPPIAHRGVWTGSELVIVGGDGVAAYDPRRQRWQTLPQTSLLPTTPVIVAWTGREVLVWGDETRDPPAATRGVRYDPETDTWERTSWLALDQGPAAAAVWTGQELFVWSSRAAVAYDPDLDTWRRLASAPVTPAGPVSAVWTGSEVVAWGERRVSSLGEQLRTQGFTVAYDPAQDRWRELDPPPFTAPDVAAAWTGSEAVVAGGDVRFRFRAAFPSAGLIGGVALDPVSGHWRAFRPPPGWERPARWTQLRGLDAVWTPAGLVLVGGHVPRMALVWAPETDSWAQLPPGPTWQTNAEATWTGEELLLWGGGRRQDLTVELASWRPS